jgi:hypothetical protein
MRKYVLIIEGDWCGITHIHSFYDCFKDAVIGARDWLAEQLYTDNDDSRYNKALIDFIENDLKCVENMFVIDEVII